MPPKITRRGFLKIGAAGATTAVLTGCQRPRRWVSLEPFVRPPEEQVSGSATWYASTCRQCPAGCGVMVRVMNGRALKLEGNPQHPLNAGKLCARGQAGLQLLYNPDRLEGPVKQAARGSRQFASISWEEGLNSLFSIVQKAGKGLAIWAGSTTSGHVLDLLSRWSEALGAPTPIIYDLYSGFNGYPLLAAANQQLGGSAAMPGYDVAQADLVLSFGADFLATWLSATHYGRAFSDFRDQALGTRGTLVQFEPRMSMTGANADRWLPLKPGSEPVVAQALLRLIADLGVGPAERVRRAGAFAPAIDPVQAALDSDLALSDLTDIARAFALAEHPLAIPGSTLAGREGPLQALQAVQALNAVSGGWQAEAPAPGQTLPARVSPYSQVIDLLQRMQAGEVGALLVCGANPLYDLPEQLGLQAALGKVPALVSFSPMVDETAAQADLILPDHTYLEAWGYISIDNGGDRPILGAQQPVVVPLRDTRATADVLLSIARGLPAADKAMPWQDEVSMLKQTIGALPAGAQGAVNSEVAWARFLQHGGWWAAAPQPVQIMPELATPIEISSAKFDGDAADYPFYLHLYLSELLSDGRGASQPWLQGSPSPMTTVAWQTWVEVNPQTAARLGLQDGDIVQVESPSGKVEAPVYIYQAIRPDTVAMPLGQGHSDLGRYAAARGANPIALVGNRTDSSSQTLTWSEIRVKLTPTGRRKSLARMENAIGVTDGFINQSQPGG
jgi:anaerobic selenocysteine-containing dehydrogenase